MYNMALKLVVAAATALAAFINPAVRPAGAAVEAACPGTDPANATYLIEGEPIALHGGVAVQMIVPGTPARRITRLQGPAVCGDLTGDGKADAAVIVTVFPGGTGLFNYVAVVPNGSATATPAVLLGDRIPPPKLTIRDGKLTVRYLERKPDEPMVAEPTVPVVRTFIYKNGLLVEPRR